MANARLIVNPVSGSENGTELLPLINAKLRAYWSDLDIVMSVGPGDAAVAAEKSVNEGYSVLFVAGGDGTLNEVINGIAVVPEALQDVTIGVLPLGTGNDFAAALGIPSDPVEAAVMMLQKQEVLVDLGMTDRGRYFVNISAGGFVAEVSDSVSQDLKNVAGRFAYLLGGAKTLKDFQPVTTDVEWIENGKKHRRLMDLQLFAVCNAPLIGGGRPIAPLAVINDGAFDVCLVESVSTIEFVSLANRIRNGDHLDDPRVAYFQTDSLKLSFDRETKINTDGEVLQARSCSYRLFPSAARFFSGFSGATAG